MIQLINEAGIGGWFVILFIIAGLAATTTVGRRWGRPGSIAGVWAVVILAMGINGFSAGQRMTDQAFRRSGDNPANPVGGTTDPNRRVAMLSRGTAEAAANLMLAGHGALLVLLVGGVLVFFRKKDENAGVRTTAPAPIKSA